MLTWTGIKVLDDVVCLSFEQVKVTVFDKEVLDLLPTDEALVLPVDATERRVRLKVYVSCQALPLSLDGELLLSHHDHEPCKA